MNKTIVEIDIEKLAQIEHDQWVEWSRAIMASENISPERLERWKKLIVPYDMLTEEQKEHDRVYARKVIAVLTGREYGVGDVTLAEQIYDAFVGKRVDK